MQNLDNHIWKSKISISAKLKLYNICILPIFLYGSKHWAIINRDLIKIDALYQWYMWKQLGINQMVPWCAEWWGETTGQPHLLAIAQAWHFSLFGHITRMPMPISMKHKPRSSHLENSLNRKPSYYADEDYTVRRKIQKPLPEWSNHQSHPLWRLILHLVLRTPSGACQKRKKNLFILM